MPKLPSKVKEKLEEAILEGKNYAETRDLLKEEFNWSLSGKTFREYKAKLVDTSDVQQVVSKVKLEKKKTRKWTKRDQKVADESKLAELINKCIYTCLPCPQKRLAEKDVQEINLGGGRIDVIMYYYPQFNLENPVIIFIMRLLMFIVKFYQLCIKVKEKINDFTERFTEKGEAKGSDEMKGGCA